MYKLKSMTCSPVLLGDGNKNKAGAMPAVLWNWIKRWRTLPNLEPEQSRSFCLIDCQALGLCYNSDKLGLDGGYYDYRLLRY